MKVTSHLLFLSGGRKENVLKGHYEKKIQFFMFNFISFFKKNLGTVGVKTIMCQV